MSFYLPDKYFSRLSDVDIKKDLLTEGITNVLLDVDNTILTRDTSSIPVDIQKWLNKAQKSGIKFCLVSNDWHNNVIDASKEVDLPIVTKSLKPLPHAFLLAKKKIGAKNSNTIMIGDQLLTDIFGAHLIGLKAYLLAPLVKKDLKHTLILRKFERIILKGRIPEPATINVNEK